MNWHPAVSWHSWVKPLLSQVESRTVKVSLFPLACGSKGLGLSPIVVCGRVFEVSCCIVSLLCQVFRFLSEGTSIRQVGEEQKRIAFLEKKVQTKDEVLGELMAEHIALKRSFGGALSGGFSRALNGQAYGKVIAVTSCDPTRCLSIGQRLPKADSWTPSNLGSCLEYSTPP